LEIGLPGRCAPGVGLRRREGCFRSAQADRWPKAFAPIEIGLLRRFRTKRRPSPTQGRLSGRRRPTIGWRPPQAEFIRRPGRPHQQPGTSLTCRGPCHRVPPWVTMNP